MTEKAAFDSDVSRMRAENRLRRLTDRIVQCPHFAPNENDRMRRIQAAYGLASDLDADVAYSRDDG